MLVLAGELMHDESFVPCQAYEQACMASNGKFLPVYECVASGVCMSWWSGRTHAAQLTCCSRGADPAPVVLGPTAENSEPHV